MDPISLVIAALAAGAIEERKVKLGQRIEIWSQSNKLRKITNNIFCSHEM